MIGLQSPLKKILKRESVPTIFNGEHCAFKSDGTRFDDTLSMFVLQFPFRTGVNS